MHIAGIMAYASAGLLALSLVPRAGADEWNQKTIMTFSGPVEQYGVRGFPTTVLIDRDGKVVGRFNGVDAKAACAEIEKLLNGKK